MVNYRVFEKWGPAGDNLFDIVYNPYIVTQKIPHWIHNGHGPWLGQAYANLCNVEFGEMFLAEDDSLLVDLPDEYMTVHGTTRTDPKDYDFFEEVLEKINFPIVQIGGETDKKLSKDGVIDLRGKTTPQQLASILRKSKLHFGGDSFPMHVAGHVGTKTVALFGGTYAKQGFCPKYAPHVQAIETQDRGPCNTSCHLLECEAKKNGFDKCINNIPIEQVIDAITNVLGEDYVEKLEPIKISAYSIIKNGEKYGFPYIAAIRAAHTVSDEVVVVDGGSEDNTTEILDDLKKELPNLKIFSHEWDMDNPTLFGDEKTYARRLCTGTHLVQFDCDELIHEPEPGMIRELVRRKRFVDVIDLPVVNFYGDTETIRVEKNFWKWRITRNDPRIIHGVHGGARIMDPETGRITMDKRKSDSCEYIYEDNLAICNHKLGYSAKFLGVHERFKEGLESEEEYIKQLVDCIKQEVVVFHYSWLDLDRKEKNGEFWDQTWHGKRQATHNTTANVSGRVANKQDKLLKIDFEHPLKHGTTTT
jgi:hypothetical protein